MFERIKYIVNLLIVALLLGAIAVGRDGRALGHSAEEIAAPSSVEQQESVETELPDGTMVFNSAPVAKDIAGFGGRTPVLVYVRDGKIMKVETEVYSETESFFDQVVASGLLKRWDGMLFSDAATKSVDAVSGATYTSSSIIQNVQRVAQYGAAIEVDTRNPLSDIGLKDIVGLLVILSGVVISFMRPRGKMLEIAQLVLNVVVLGFCCGSFLSISQFVSWMSNGINLSMSLVTVALLLTVVFMPLLGRKGSYCHMHCPMGSAQELLGRLPIGDIKLGAAVNQFLNKLRYYILFVLLFVMWIGFGFELMDYEIFSAFIYSSASTVVLVMAGVFLLLSLFVHRPYCRFVCPTGALITIAQRTKE